MAGVACRAAVRWGLEEEVVLAEIEREASGKRAVVLRLAALRLPGRSEAAVISKRGELGFSAKSLVQERLREQRRAKLARVSLVVPLGEAPERCPGCGGRWWLERDPEAGMMLVCWGCSREMYVR